MPCVVSNERGSVVDEKELAFPRVILPSKGMILNHPLPPPFPNQVNIV